MRKLTQQDLDNLIGKTYNGYMILKARIKGGEFSDSDHYGIALGRNSRSLYVTWQFHLDGEAPDFYWGHYLDNEAAAVADYNSRIE